MNRAHVVKKYRISFLETSSWLTSLTWKILRSYFALLFKRYYRVFKGYQTFERRLIENLMKIIIFFGSRSIEIFVFFANIERRVKSESATVAFGYGSHAKFVLYPVRLRYTLCRCINKQGKKFRWVPHRYGVAAVFKCLCRGRSENVPEVRTFGNFPEIS